MFLKSKDIIFNVIGALLLLFLVQNLYLKTCLKLNLRVLKCSDICSKKYVLNTVLVLVDETVILCKYYIELGCF